jgi:hypothetical protein
MKDTRHMDPHQTPGWCQGGLRGSFARRNGVFARPRRGGRSARRGLLSLGLAAHSSCVAVLLAPPPPVSDPKTSQRAGAWLVPFPPEPDRRVPGSVVRLPARDWLPLHDATVDLGCGPEGRARSVRSHHATLQHQPSLRCPGADCAPPLPAALPRLVEPRLNPEFPATAVCVVQPGVESPRGHECMQGGGVPSF